jgi:pyrimidine deaminase RibD-like protein
MLEISDSQEKGIREFMNYCFNLALSERESGVRFPLVGSVVVSPEGKIIGSGRKHIIYGTSLTIHAEREAISEADFRAKKSTLITTLEPSYSHEKNKGNFFESSVKLIIASGIKKVIFGFYDSKMDGTGLKVMEEKGIQIARYTGFDKSPVSQQLGRNYRTCRRGEFLDRLIQKGLL